LPTSLRRTALACAVIVVSTSACTTRVEGAAVPAPDLTPPTSSPSQPDPVNVPEGFDETPEVQLEPGKPGGTFRVADYEPSTIDPAEAVTGSDVLVTGNLFTGMTVAGPDMKVGPGAAESWEADEDCTTWTFNLKPGGKFHNGEAVTAKSFVAGWKRGAAGSGAGYQMEGVKGYPKVEQGLKTPDDQTLTVALSKPDCEFPVRVAHPVFSPQPKAKFAKRAPVGNGPFKLDGSWRPGGELTLARFDEYAIGDKPYLDKVVIVPIDDPAAGVAGFQSTYDWARATGSQLRAARDQHAPKGNWISRNVPGYTGLVPMVGTQPLKSAAARKALSLAIDREQLSETVFDGSQPPATGLVSSAFDGVHQPDACSACQYDPAKAEQLAKEGGLSKRTKLTLAFPQRPETQTWAEAIREQLEKNLGITVQLQPLPPDKFYERQGKTNARGLYRGAWLPDVATPDDMLRPLLTTRGIANGTNPGRYSNKQFDKLLDRAARTSDEARRAELYQQAEQLAIGTDMALIPLLERTEFRLADNEKFMNLRMDFYENPDLRVISLR